MMRIPKRISIFYFSEYQKEALKIVDGEYYSSANKLRPEKIGRFEYRKVDWRSERGNSGTIFVFPANRLYSSELSGDPKLSLISTINSSSGNSVFYIIKTLNQAAEKNFN